MELVQPLTHYAVTKGTIDTLLYIDGYFQFLTPSSWRGGGDEIRTSVSHINGEIARIYVQSFWFCIVFLEKIINFTFRGQIHIAQNNSLKYINKCCLL